MNNTKEVIDNKTFYQRCDCGDITEIKVSKPDTIIENVKICGWYCENKLKFN